MCSHLLVLEMRVPRRFERLVGVSTGCCYLKFWVKVTALERNRRFSIYFRS